MSFYLLSVHNDDCEPAPSMTPDEMQASMERVMALESEMREQEVFVFTARLDDAASAVVAHPGDGLSMTDGPFAETKEHIAGFYLLDVSGPDEAHEWAAKVVECVGRPIEVRQITHGGR